MACSCHEDHCNISEERRTELTNPKWRRALWIALALNAAMFVVELSAGLKAGSVSLLADSIDFAGDAANYGLSLAVLSMAVVWRSRAAMIKGISMFAFGIFVLGQAAWTWQSGSVPEPVTMGAVGFLAMIVNAGVAVMLYAFRAGDANMRSVWLCSRNDAISNVAVMVAALGVFGTGTAWPDLIVATIMAVLALSAGASVMGQAKAELDGRAEPGTTLEAGHHHDHGH
ncbi:cation diffusion facilitator family transporter [Hydrogenophaga sp. 5NK40-0174]